MLSKHFLPLLLLASLLGRSEPLKVRGRIVAGNEANSGQFPWHVLVKTRSSLTPICGGSIVSPKWVLTASKCLRNSPVVILVFGALTFNDSNALKMTSSMLYMHPYLNAALIKLPEPLVFDERIESIDLARDNFKRFNMTGEIAEISGFGFSGDAWEDHKTERLKYTTVQLMDIRECHTSAASEFVCAKNEKPTGSVCDGDMGGAMAWSDENGKPTQIALISESPKFCDWPSPLIFVKIKTLMGWIEGLSGVGGGAE